VSDIDVAVGSELLFRAVNERILEIGAKDVETLEILCECGDESCISTVVITVRDYERLRLDSRRFVVCEGHELADIERVTERTPEYLVVEKGGRAPEVVVRGFAEGPAPSRRGSVPGRPRPPAAP
jgi:hypothetical protein